MPNLLRQIPETMRKLGIPEETAAQFVIPSDYSSEAVIGLAVQMDRFLTEEQRLAVMQEQGCCKTGNPAAPHKAFGKEHAGKTLAEKVDLLNKADIVHKSPSRLNTDGPLSVFWGEDGLQTRDCPCGVIKKLPAGTAVPKTFCGCCGGHIRANYQRSLGVKLRLKEIVSSSSSSNGRKRCEFLFEVDDIRNDNRR
jgi:hypothetical protein